MNIYNTFSKHIYYITEESVRKFWLKKKNPENYPHNSSFLQHISYFKPPEGLKAKRTQNKTLTFPTSLNTTQEEACNTAYEHGMDGVVGKTQHFQQMERF